MSRKKIHRVHINEYENPRNRTGNRERGRHSLSGDENAEGSDSSYTPKILEPAHGNTLDNSGKNVFEYENCSEGVIDEDYIAKKYPEIDSLLEKMTDDPNNKWVYKAGEAYFLKREYHDRGFGRIEAAIIAPQVQEAVKASKEIAGYHHALVKVGDSRFYVEVSAAGRIALPILKPAYFRESRETNIQKPKWQDLCGRTDDPEKIRDFKAIKHGGKLAIDKYS